MDTSDKLANAIDDYRKAQRALAEAQKALPVAERVVERMTAALAKTMHAVYGDEAEVLDEAKGILYSIDSELRLTESFSKLRVLGG